MSISLKSSKKWLAAVWFFFSAVILLLVIVQTILGYYGKQIFEVWSWLLPTIIPSLFLISGVMTFEGSRESNSVKKTDRFLFGLTFMLSIFYFILILLNFILQPFTEWRPTELLNISNYWLAPVQGIVTATLGVFFIKTERS